MLKTFIFIFISYFFIFSDKKAYSPPPGTDYLYEDLYIDTIVITNLDWLEYQENYFAYNKTPYYPDTSYYVDGLNYFYTEKFEYEPVYGISPKAALHYCKWRANFINYQLKVYSKKSKCKSPYYIENYKLNINVEYDVPSQSDIDKALEKGLVKLSKFEYLTKENSNLNDTNFTNYTFICVAKVIELDKKQ
jgi:hypothetical protein